MSRHILMRSVSGLRAVVGEGLSPENIVRHVAAFSDFLEAGPLVVGRDSRVSGPFILELVKGVLMAKGRKVIDIGITPTPTVQLMVEKMQAAGGIAITASHNPVQWNGLKFIGSDGLFLPPENIQKVFHLADQNDFEYVPYEKLGQTETYSTAIEDHIQAILNIPYIDIEKIRQKKFKVVVDTVNGAGGLIIPKLLKQLGCDVIALNQEPSGLFAHTPEPLPENLTELSKSVQQNRADIGFAVDPDVDRCAIVDEMGTPLGEEYTLALAVKLVLSKKLGPVVTNLSTSRVIDDLVMYHNAIGYRTPVGEIHVAKKMREVQAVIGGEGNGGVILPDVHLGRDAPVAIALTLQLLSENEATISQLKAKLPEYHMIKDKVNVAGINTDAVFSYFKEKFKNEKINEDDGLKIDFQNYWVHLRKSNTEPILRVMVEAQDLKSAKQIVEEIKKEIAKL